jgi:hypothetical protein
MRLDKPEEALDHLKSAIALREDMRLAWLVLGTVAPAGGRLEESIRHSREFVRRFLEDPEVPVTVEEIRLLERELERSNAYLAGRQPGRTPSGLLG